MRRELPWLKTGNFCLLAFAQLDIGVSDMSGPIFSADFQELEWDEEDHPRSRLFDDNFYSTGDGRLECQHVFLAGNGLPEGWLGRDHHVIGELGFGTGLNMLETWHTWTKVRRPGQMLSLVTFELALMDPASMRRAIAHWPELLPRCDRLLTGLTERRAGLEVISLDAQTDLTVIPGDCRNTLPRWSGMVDSWFLDGFSPSKNPEMWALDTTEQVFCHTNPGGSFATYASAGWVRRNFQQAGFEVQRKPGFGRKRHMSTGRRPLAL